MLAGKVSVNESQILSYVIFFFFFLSLTTFQIKIFARKKLKKKKLNKT